MTNEETKGRLCPLSFIHHQDTYCEGDTCVWWHAGGMCDIDDTPTDEPEVIQDRRCGEE